MRRMLLAAATSSALALAVPGVASAAHSSKCHRRAHHACSHLRHAQRAGVFHFGAATPGPAAGGATTPPSTGAASPTTPATPGSAGETAGTVTSFTNGVLTITLNDGSTVSGKVTEQTDIRCQPATPPAEGTDPDEQGDEAGNDHSGNGPEHGGPGLGSHGDDMSGGGPQQAGGGDDGEGDGQGSDDGQQSCTTAALVAGAVVRDAELSVGGSGAVWDRVDLIQ